MSDPIPVFIPALSAILLHAEDAKGAPLTPEEVLEIRDKASVIMMEPEDAATLARSRGYSDIDPENCWYDWQMLRREMGRTPDLDPGARVRMHPSDDPGMRQAESTAREQLGRFRALLGEHPDRAGLVKLRFEEPSFRGGVWLWVTEDRGGAFEAELFELPPGMEVHQVGERHLVHDDALLDWMLNLEGVLHGGFTLRYHRGTLTTEEERAQFDRHIGVVEYALAR